MSPLHYLSVCSGIEAASVAWAPLGWSPFGFAEIEAFPSAVLAHHHGSNLPGEIWRPSNGVPNFGDMNLFKGWPDGAIDLLVGGTPCQSFSVAGLRKGMADPRGNLALTYLAIADRYRPEWVVWENVPGVLSSSGGRDFGAFLGGLAELGYGFAWRVLDAQYVRVDGFGRAVPQRRRRVFVVGNSRDWRRAASVLFEPESLSWDSPPRREAGEGIAGPIAGCSNGGGANGPGRTADDADSLVAFGGNDTGGPIDVATARNAHAGPHGRLDFESETFVVAHTLSAARGKAQAHGHAAIAFDTTQITSTTNRSQPRDGDPCHPLAAEAHPPAIALQQNGTNLGTDLPSLRRGDGGFTSGVPAVSQGWAVRRLTPRECERLQGFPDDYTLIPYRGKPAADGPRYKALGNSMAVNVMRWIGRRIEMVSGIVSEMRVAA